MAEWIQPKTDWSSADYINAEDYNRIIGNMAYLVRIAKGLFMRVTSVDLGAEKSYADLIYAREVNALETALNTLNLETYVFDLGETKEYLQNGKTIDFNELNRIENAMLRLYESEMVHRETLPILAFTLGNQKGIKV